MEIDEQSNEYEVVLTPQFLEDLESCVSYVSHVLASPLAARKMFETVREKVFALAVMPQAASSYTSKTTGATRYKISYNKYDIHYVIEGETVRVLGMKHQIQQHDRID